MRLGLQTMHTSGGPGGPDSTYEEKFFHTTSDKLTAGLDDTPHIALSKPRGMDWKHVGSWMKKALWVSDWRATADPTVMFSPRLGGFRQSMTSVFHCQKTVQLVDDETLICVSTSPTDPPPASVPPELADIPLVSRPQGRCCFTWGRRVIRSAPKKLQFCKQQVVFLGHLISQNQRLINPKRIRAIQNIARPVTKKQMMSFLGMTGYCRAFIPDYSELEHPLTSCIHGKGLNAHDRVVWTSEAEQAFTSLKMALGSAPALALPDPAKPFTQTVDEKRGFMSSVLLQAHGDRLRPVAYFSTKLDSVAAGLPSCLRAVAACEKAVAASRDIVGYNPLTVLVPHSVSVILLEQKTSHLSAARWRRYTTVLLDMPNVTVKRCTTLNPATLLPTAEDGEPHCCEAALEQTCSPRPDISDVPLSNPDFVFFTDGSSFRDASGTNRVGFAVCTSVDTVSSGPLPSHYSAQAAELVALTEACKLAEGHSVTIFTDSSCEMSGASEGRH
ncbi:uncharacterized protein LOC115429108 [Sphaeramia orbicularis]|uniref:uncharacterized protein LOC115429108 n=1 Tax=Sphaeramia orbicularis TaxID=375764 RepID=UPI00117E0427|nr:uncharacterized protein LOC115429108 [Sphaeramia orbicularis]